MPPPKRFDAGLACRCTATQKRKIQKVAKRAGLDVATWLRVVALVASDQSDAAESLLKAKDALASRR